ncbi:hypothetical protein Droror1_Dr00014201 [Drosera rotundifolia]
METYLDGQDIWDAVEVGVDTLLAGATTSEWIFSQIESGSGTFHLLGQKDADGVHEVSIREKDIHHLLNFTNDKKFDIPYVTMYCKDECSSLLKDPQQDALNDRKDDKPMLKWHKVVWAIRELDKKWRLLQKRKSALRMYYSRRFEEEAGRAYDESMHITEANEHYTEGLRTLTNKLFRCFSSGLGLEEHELMEALSSEDMVYLS